MNMAYRFLAFRLGFAESRVKFMSSGRGGNAPSGGSSDGILFGESFILQFLQKIEERQNHRLDDLDKQPNELTNDVGKRMDRLETILHNQALVLGTRHIKLTAGEFILHLIRL